MLAVDQRVIDPIGRDEFEGTFVSLEYSRDWILSLVTALFDIWEVIIEFVERPMISWPF